MVFLAYPLRCFPGYPFGMTSIDQIGYYEHSDHSQGQRDLGRGAQDQAEERTVSYLSRPDKVAFRQELADCCPCKRTNEDADEAEKDPDNAADRRADDRLSARPRFSRTRAGGRKIDHKGQRRQNAEHNQRQPADLCKTVDPGGKEEAREDQHWSRKNGYDCSDDTGDHQHDGNYPEKYRHRWFVARDYECFA
jgi:hypothetical protein